MNKFPNKLTKRRMPCHITIEIQTEIMKRFPVKSLVRFRSVSKPWKSVIDSSEFITSYKAPNTQPQHIFISYFDTNDCKEKYVSIADDDTFPRNMSFRAAPKSINQLPNPYPDRRVIGSSQGLFCFYSSGTTVIWNPTVGKSVVIRVPNVFDPPYETVVGFAVCPRTKDPKLVKFTFIMNSLESKNCIPWQVEVYTLSSGVWRTPPINLPSKFIAFTGDQELLDGFIYFLSIYRHVVNGVHRCDYIIMSFDMIKEEFTKICIPYCINSCMFLTMSKLKESLVLLEYYTRDVYERKVCDVWMMEGSVTKSFKKVFSIIPYDDGSVLERVVGFRMNGEALIVMKHDLDNSDDSDNSEDNEFSQYSLIAYDPYSTLTNNIGISGVTHSFFANCYTETLLLLDH